MTLFSPVVITEDENAAEAALARGWHVVRRYPGSDKVITINGNPVLCGIPAPELRIADCALDDQFTPVWNYVLNWIAGHVLRPLLVVEPNDYLTDLALWSASSRGWPVGALVTGSPELTPQAVALLSAADGLFVPDGVRIEAFEQEWSVPYSLLEHAPMVSVAPRRPLPPRKRVVDATKVLLVAHDAGAGSTLAAQRAGLLFDYLEATGGDVSVDVASAMTWPDAPARMHRVLDLDAANWAPGRGPTSGTANHLFDKGNSRPYPVTRMVGGTWNRALERYFDTRANDHYDVVVITGHPAYFDFASFARRRWYARTVLDYPAPFAASHVEWPEDVRADVHNLEHGFNLNVDAIMVPDQAGAGLVVRSNPASDIVVVPTPGGGSTTAAADFRALIRRLGDHSFSPPY
ncbi:hypothetical protein H5392_02990 [Tessaracoccus sp. MC1865]|uniref:hypothetical protein n=1 Tax=Tessaracoccus sp. MC1865 TaxID=2760310 RepID=UPI00160472C6|nr:hypothetical protein [Tessaracoccus sp. MC1865]MBB1482825.1 hypothetical protein [Tessaracoccus sp. MC1865]QTO37735.1 hypothetical protein J7D54_01100 [Tessaracoccus sp. MC1865]